MLKSDAAAFLAGVKQVEGAPASAPTNLHVITGEVGATSEDGKTTISLDGLVFSEEDSQEIEMDTLGGLEEGDIATVLLTGENGRGMTPLAIGAPGSIDRIKTIASNAAETADAAQEVAEAVTQHFFADDNGIHVTEATQEDWDASHTGANVLINSIGQLFRDGLNNLLTLTTQDGARALAIWDGLGNAASNVLATFGATETHIGMSGAGNVYMANDSFRMSATTSEWETSEPDALRHVTQEAVLDSTMAEQVLTSNCNIQMTNSQEVNEGGSGGATVYIGAGIGPTNASDPQDAVYASIEASADLGGGSDITFIADQISYADPYGGSDRQLGKPTRLTASKSCTAATNDTRGPSVTLTAGTWLVHGIWSFTNSSSSSKRLVVGLDRSSTGNAFTWRIYTTAASNYAHRLELVDTVVISAASETITLYGGSTPASTAAATQYIAAIKLA